uniref:Uncharacterized protein n=1 Tax=Panagrolaimus sp. ES5 TaxID=591445 RepID=A0AC34FBQ8_9BILA
MVNISGAECACRCSTKSPEECQNPVRFEGNVDSSLLPLFTLPAPQGVIGSKANILWQEAKIKLIPSVGARCNISGAYYLKNDRLWQEASPSLFYIDWFEDNAKLFWNGTILEAKQLEGTIIQLKLDCFGHSRNAHCLSFRIAGQTGPLVSRRNILGQSTTGYQGRFETIQSSLKNFINFLEFFEPHFMMNPPPMAEQFLHDLRKMIDLAKHRIHGKKHIPQLVSIPEEAKEHYEPYMELQNRPQDLQVTTPTIYSTREEENSPKSVKSCDSGRESMRDASSTESVASSADLNGPKARSPIPSLPNGGVKNLAKEFESPKNESKNRKAASRIPVITGFAKSPKLSAKSNPISIANSKAFAEVPPLPPRNRPTSPLNNISNNNNNSCTTPPLPSSPPPPRITSNGIPQPVSHARRKTYAVFPTDPMLKKSLPRRTKKKPSVPANGIIETNM